MAMASISLPFPHPTKSNSIPLSNSTNKILQCSTTNSKLKVSKNGQFPSSIVKETGNKKIPINNINKNLEKKNSVWVNTVTEALTHCIDNKQWFQALEVFEMLREQPFYQPKEKTYMKLVVLLGKSGEPERARQLFVKMVEEGLEPTKELYDALITAYTRISAITEAFSILEQMKILPLCQPDVNTFNILIKACIDDCRFDLVDSLYRQMDERLITPNTFTHTIVLSGYGKAGKFEQMEKVFSGMLVSTTCMPDVWTMNTILSLFGKKGQIEMMEKWYEKFCNLGIEPVSPTFDILISAYGKIHMYDKMLSVMGYMRKLSLPWTTSTYNNIIDVFAEVGHAKNMEYTFDQMRAEGVKIDNRTLSCLIRGYSNAGLFQKVISSVQLAGKLEIPKNTSFYNRAAKAWFNTVIEAFSDCIERKEWRQALEVFEMLRKQPFYEPGEETYKKLLVLLGKSGQPEHARQLFVKMIEEGLEPTTELYTALIDAYCRNNAITEAFSVLEQMKTLPLCQPDVYTFNILIKACIDDCQFDLVDFLYKQMDGCSVTPNTFTQTFVLSGYGKAGRYEQMEKVFSDMLLSTTCMPDVRTMNSILGLFGKKGQIEMMEKWYEKFCNVGIEPETHTFNILISAYGKKHMYAKMFSMMGYMRKLAFPWTTPTYNTIIDAFAEVGDAEKMEYTFNQMRAEEMKIDNRTFCCLIRGYANAGLFHKVKSNVQLAAKLGIQENTSFYNAVIYASAKAGDLMEMDRVFIRMKDKHCQADSITYELMIEAYRKEGMNDGVYDLEQESNISTNVDV